MKRFILFLLITGLVLTASAQRVYFIYLQAEPAQPFFIKMDGKIHSSSSSGYLILSRLPDSTYSFSVGFPQEKWPEQPFTVKIGQRDHGFLLKQFAEKGWGLYDLRSMQIQYSAAPVVKEAAPEKPENKDVSPFTDLLSKATGDPSLRDKPPAPRPAEKPVAEPVVARTDIPVKEEPKPEAKDTALLKSVAETAAAIKPADKPATQMPVDVKPVAVPVVNTVEEVKKELADPVQKEPAPAPVTDLKTVTAEPLKKNEPEPVKEVVPVAVTEPVPVKPAEVNNETVSVLRNGVVTKRAESSTTEGFGLVFLDSWEGGMADTIRLLIPNPKQIFAAPVKEEPKEEKKFLDIPATAVKSEDKPAEVNPEVPKAAEKVKEELPKTEAKPVLAEEKAVTTGNCTAVAEESDFFALRKSMAAAEGDEEMISQAKKYFKMKCFTVAQLKNLSSLFLNDEAKYNFFDAAYKYTSDKPAFSSLQAELKDPYYINRFKAMLL